MVMSLSKPHLKQRFEPKGLNPNEQIKLVSHTYMNANIIELYVKRDVYIAFGKTYERSQPITLTNEVEPLGSITLDLDNPPTHYF